MRRGRMRATLIYGAGDIRVEDVADPELVEPTDALVRIIVGLDEVPDGYRTVNDREALNVQVAPSAPRR